MQIFLQSNFTANGASATSGIAITGDPGAKAKYTFSVTLTAAANETIEARTQQIIATAAGGQKATGYTESDCW